MTLSCPALIEPFGKLNVPLTSTIEFVLLDELESVQHILRTLGGHALLSESGAKEDIIQPDTARKGLLQNFRKL